MIDSRATPHPDNASRSETHPERGEAVPRRGRALHDGMTLRLRQLGWALMLVLGSAAGATLATVWITSIPVVALGAGIPLTLLATLLIRWFADMHRRWAADRLGEPVTRSYLPDDQQAVQRMLSDAQKVTTDALAELRDLVRGIHPPVLADRGLDGALRALALVNPIETTVVTHLPGRLPAPVESAAYFAVHLHGNVMRPGWHASPPFQRNDRPCPGHGRRVVG